MIRILATDHPAATKITIDGELVGEYVEAVQNSVDQAIGQKRPVHLFLRDVGQMDEQGRTLLRHLAARGVELSASGLYTSYVVAEIRGEIARRITGAGPPMLPKMRT